MEPLKDGIAGPAHSNGCAHKGSEESWVRD